MPGEQLGEPGLLAVQRGLPRRTALAWTAIGALLGPLGVLLMLVEQEFPARVTCAECGARRPVNADSCPACSAPWPAPPADATCILS